MSDDRRLVDRVGKLASAQRPPAGPRELSSSGGDAALAAILREIDETILPRSLEFRCGQAMLRLTAGNRRLIAVEAAQGPDDVSDDLLGTPLNRPDPGTLAALRRLFDAILSGGGTVMVWADQAPDRHGAIGAGATAISLASAWNIDLIGKGGTAGTPESALAAFLATVESTARAWVGLSAGNVTESGGDGALIARLKDFASSEDMANLDLGSGSNAPSFIAVGRAPDEGNCLICISEMDASALVVIPASELETAKATWLRAIGR